MVNLDITKFLQSVRSVDDIEWICQTCNNHLKKKEECLLVQWLIACNFQKNLLSLILMN